MAAPDYDVVIIGGGAAGLTAGLYSSRAGLKTVLLERMMTGGQVINAEKIENFPGFPNGLSGAELGPLIQEQATTYGLELKLSEVTAVHRDEPNWAVETHGGALSSKALIIAGGSTLRKLGVPGEEQMHGAGVSYCATCDGPFFMDQTVCVVGGGDSALDEAVVLTEFASKVIVFHRAGQFSGQRILQDRVLSNPKVEARWNTVVTAILGEGQVEGVATMDVTSEETSRADLSGVFIYVGLDPNSDYLQDLLPLDNAGHVPADTWMRTTLPGLLAAGDIRQNSASQLVSAAGDGATAAIAAQRYIETGSWPS